MLEVPRGPRASLPFAAVVGLSASAQVSTPLAKHEPVEKRE